MTLNQEPQSIVDPKMLISQNGLYGLRILDRTTLVGAVSAFLLRDKAGGYRGIKEVFELLKKDPTRGYAKKLEKLEGRNLSPPQPVDPESFLTSLTQNLAYQVGHADLLLDRGNDIIEEEIKTGRITKEEKQVYQKSLKKWLATVGASITFEDRKNTIDRASRLTNIDEGLFFTPVGLSGLRQGDLVSTPATIRAQATDPGSIFYYHLQDQGTIDDSVRSLIHTVSRSLLQDFAVSRTTPQRFLIVPQDWIVAGGCADADDLIVLSHNIPISDPGHISREAIYHEIIHSILSSLLNGRHPPSPDIIEGFASSGVKWYADPHYREAIQQFFNAHYIKAYELLKSNPRNTAVSSTRMMKERGETNLDFVQIYKESYRMDALADVLICMFPSHWRNIMKDVYSQFASDLTDAEGKILVKNGAMLPEVQYRQVLHSALVRALEQGIQYSERAAWLENLEQNGLQPSAENIKKFAESMAYLKLRGSN